MAMIHEALVAIMRDTEAIGKEQRNQSQGFNFRGIDDVMNSLHGVFAKHGVFISPKVLEHRTEEKQTKSGGYMTQHIVRVEYTFTAADGSTHPMSMDGESADSGDKGTSKAVSIAMKYALIQAFLIPTAEEKDPDYQSPKLERSTRRAGSKLTAEQQQVLDRKLEEAKAAREQTKPANYDMLQYFAEMKKKLGDKEYYFILGGAGFDKSNQISDIKEARRIYAMMAERAKEIDLERDGGLPQQ